jgi:hypothetical protein
LKDESDVRVPHFSDIEARCNVRLQSLFGPQHLPTGASISIPRPMPWASTANFLKAHGWVRGAGYQPGEPNFAAIQGWNAARVYEEAIATIGRQIDEH